MEHLEHLVRDLFDKTKNCDPDIIRSLYEAEHAIELDYRGRYIFELLQNARDAALTAGVLARLKIIIEENQLVVANNGSEFNNEGLRSICRIGLSSKRSNNALIGNKGMGFKSVLEVTNQPQITTSAGTIYFDQLEAHKKIGDTQLEAHELPLMFFPLYSPTTIQDCTEIGSYSTVIKLPYLPGISADNVKREIQLLRSTMFPLLGNFEQLDIVDKTTGNTIQYHIEFPTPQYCIINKTGESFFKLRLFEHRFLISPEMIAQFSEDERELIKTDTPVEIRVAIRIDKDGRFVPLDLTSLYLFYPLEESSGFRFIIHSQFVVTPNRKSLLDKSLLNKVILEELVNFLSGNFLDQISKEFADQVTDIMVFSEMTQGVLSRYSFFKVLQQSLRSKPILWNSVAGRHLSTSEFFLLSTVHSRVFKESRIGDRYIVYIPNQAMCDWLVKSMGAEWLPNHYITSHIEEYCQKQLERGKIGFFSDLYAFAKQYKLFLKGKKILLSQHGLLLDQNSEVYYGGQRTDISIPAQLRSTFTFLHDAIKLIDVRGSEIYTGVIEYNTERLINKAIKLFTDQAEVRPALLLLFRNLFSVTDLPKKLMDELLLPVENEDEWTRPYFTPLYFRNAFIEESFPNAKFVDLNPLLSIDNNRDKWISFLRKCNVWSAPALFVRRSALIIDPRHLVLLNNDGDKTVELENDIVLDMPDQLATGYQQQVLTNHNLYDIAISRFSNTWPLVRRGARQDVFKGSTFYYSLSEAKWIYTDLKSTKAYRPSELFGLAISDEGQQGAKAIQRYNPIVFLSETDIDFLVRFGLISLRKLDVHAALRLFILAKENSNGEPPQETDYSSAWNKLYGFVFEFWRKATDSEKNNLVEGFKKLPLLAEAPKATTNRWVWSKGADILYIDDKPLYDYIPAHIELPPQFTKRDRNEIGMVLQKVGIILSRRIVTDLVAPDITRTVPFIEFWHWTKFVLPILEDDIGNNLDETQLDLIRTATVAEVSGLSTIIKVSFGKEEQYQQGIPYYLSKSSDGHMLLVDRDGLTPPQLAQAANEFLNEILGTDTNILLQILELSKSRDSADAMRILDSLNIDTTRINEINELFNSRPITTRIAFWNAMANIFDLASISTEDEIPQLLSTLASRGFRFDLEYDLNQKWTPEIAAAIAKTLRFSGKDPVLLVPLLKGIVDLQKISQDHFYALLLERKQFFVSSLYQYLCSNDMSRQKRFLSIIYRYKELYKNFGSIDLFADFDQVLSERINPILSSFSLDGSFNYAKDGEGMDETKHYNSCLQVFRERITESGLDSKHLPEFLGNLDTQSLLCFDVPLVVGLYSEFLTARQLVADDAELAPSSTSHHSPINNKPVIPATVIRPSRAGSSGGPARKKSTPNGLPLSPKRPSQETLDKIGLAGELYVYKKLSEQYTNVEWLSVNAEKAGYAVRGDDTIGYDIKYLDVDGTVRFVEVKATSGQSRRFQISAAEVAAGIEHSEYYKIFFVTNALDSVRTTAYDLGLVFKGCLTLGDFVNSDLFQVDASEYTVVFEDWDKS